MRPLSSFRRAIFRSAVIGVFGLLTGILHAVTLTTPPQVSPRQDSATIVWKTDVECGTRLNYGTKPDGLSRRAEGDLAKEHNVKLDHLQPGTTYYFAVGSARQRLATGSFSTSAATGSTSVATSPATQPAPPKATPGLLSRVLSTIGLTDSKPAPAPPLAPNAPGLSQAPPTRATWGNLPSLQDHFDRHGADFGATSPDDYAAKAWLFREKARASSWPMKQDSDGTVRMWDGRSGSFAAYNRNGTTKTYFKPGNSSYWQRQPGRPITPDQLSFR